MPETSIASGCVDLILSPEGIAVEIGGSRSATLGTRPTRARLTSAQRGPRRRRPKPHLISRQVQIALAILYPDQLRVLPQDDVGRAKRSLDCRIAELAPGSSLPRCRGQELGLRLCPALSANQENDDHDHQQEAESTTEHMEWRPQVKPGLSDGREAPGEMLACNLSDMAAMLSHVSEKRTHSLELSTERA
jgi:hypothetical protein